MAHHPVVRYVVQAPVAQGGERRLEYAPPKSDGSAAGDATAAVDRALLAERKRISHAVFGGGAAPVAIRIGNVKFERCINTAEDVAAWRDELIAGLAAEKR